MNNQTASDTKVGRTWPDVVARLPLWLLSIAALAFAAVVAYALLLANKQVEFGFLGK